MYFFHVLLRIAMWVQQWGREGWKCRVRKPISQLMKTPMHSHSLCTISYCLVQVYCNDVLNRNYLNFPASSVVHRWACYRIWFYCNGRFYSFRTKKRNTSSRPIKYLAFSLGPHTNINLLGCNACCHFHGTTKHLEATDSGILRCVFVGPMCIWNHFQNLLNSQLYFKQLNIKVGVKNRQN